MIWPSGAIHEGWWKDNQAFGNGRRIHTNGNVLTGNWTNDSDGNGLIENTEGEFYQGNWQNYKSHGHGVFLL